MTWITILFALLIPPFFSAENIVTVLIGGLVSMGAAQLFKNATGAYGFAMLIVAIAITFIVALVAIVVSAFFNGEPVNWSALPQYGTQLFMLATVGYKLLLADNED